MKYIKDFKISFIGIGAPKCGTTWLSQCLKEHPQIYIPEVKEVNFFDQRDKIGNYRKGIEWYEKVFDKPEAKGKILGEYTTHYMYHPGTHELIKKHFPEIKLLIVLRKPWEMAYSLFKWKKANFTAADLPDNFEELVNEDSEYVDKALYSKHLEKFFLSFPKNNIKVFLHDEIKKNPKEVLKSTYSFIGVDPDFEPPSLFVQVNPAKKTRNKFFAKCVSWTLDLIKKTGFQTLAKDMSSSPKLSKIYTKINKKIAQYPPLEDDLKAKLVHIFRADLEKLGTLADISFEEWLRNP